MRQQMILPDIDTIRRGLPLPPLLVSLMESGRWVHPGADKLRAVAKYIEEPLTILPSLDSMLFNSGPLMSSRETESQMSYEYRGSAVPYRNLPWIDIEKTIFIMCNERIGDDCGIAPDYRTSLSKPRVICSDWHTEFSGVRISRDRCVVRRISDPARPGVILKRRMTIRWTFTLQPLVPASSFSYG